MVVELESNGSKLSSAVAVPEIEVSQLAVDIRIAPNTDRCVARDLRVDGVALTRNQRELSSSRDASRGSLGLSWEWENANSPGEGHPEFSAGVRVRFQEMFDGSAPRHL
jgi:hypothetical protein